MKFCHSRTSFPVRFIAKNHVNYGSLPGKVVVRQELVFWVEIKFNNLLKYGEFKFKMLKSVLKVDKGLISVVETEGGCDRIR